MKRLRTFPNILRPHSRNVIPSGSSHSIGPFIYMDHLGPYQISPDTVIRVPDHPHAGLATFSFLFDGEGFHTDNLGNRITLKKGQLNHMNSGNGIIHSEGLSDQFSKSGGLLHGFQIWSYLSDRERKVRPSFNQISTVSWSEEQLHYTLIAGRYRSREVQLVSDRQQLILSIRSKDRINLKLSTNPDWEYLVYLCEGSIKMGSKQVFPFEGLSFNGVQNPEILFEGNSRLLIIGGEPIPYQPVIYQSYVGSDYEEITSLLNVSHYEYH